jgi:hypothetical protein
VPPDYTRVQRIARDQQREPEPDWQQSPDEDAENEQRREQFEDDYDPDWSDTAAAEVYNDHGELTESPTASQDVAAPGAPQPRDPRLEGERRGRPGSTDEPEDPEPGPHIDIIA